MVTQFGMSEKLGVVALEAPRNAPFLPVPTAGQKEYSEETARLIDEEIKKLLNDAQNKVRDILAAYRQALEEIARVLLEKEVLERPELLRILKVRNIDGAKDKERTHHRGQDLRDQRPSSNPPNHDKNR